MMNHSYSVTSLTPIVTGDNNCRNDELLASGILGSLRYQFWLVKAMQAWSANPEQPVYPPYSVVLPPKNKKNDQEFLSALDKAGSVVQIFGATNWKRMFKMEITDAKKIDKKPQPCSARSGGASPYCWKFTLTFRQDRKSPTFNELAEKKGITLENEIQQLMSFIHHYGWLGAAPQNGLGWVHIKVKKNSGNWQEIENETSIIPQSGNPVFFARDIRHSKSCFNELIKTLAEEYQRKESAAKNMVKYYSMKLSAASSNKERKDFKKILKDEKIKIQRYQKSLSYLIKERPPVGYEIRRWLKAKNFGAPFFGNKEYANYFHVTHPIEDKANHGYYRQRLRCCSRPGDREILPDNKGFHLARRLTPEQMISSAQEYLIF